MLLNRTCNNFVEYSSVLQVLYQKYLKYQKKNIHYCGYY